MEYDKCANRDGNQPVGINSFAPFITNSKIYNKIKRTFAEAFESVNNPLSAPNFNYLKLTDHKQFQDFCNKIKPKLGRLKSEKNNQVCQVANLFVQDQQISIFNSIIQSLIFNKQNCLDFIETEIAKTSEALSKVQTIQSALNEKIINLSDGIAELSHNSAELQISIVQLIEQISTATDKISSYQKEIDHFEDIFVSDNKFIQQLNANLRQFILSQSSLRSKQTILTTQNSAISTDCVAFTMEVHNLAKDKQMKEIMLHEKQLEVATIQTENQTIQEEIQLSDQIKHESKRKIKQVEQSSQSFIIALDKMNNMVNLLANSESNLPIKGHIISISDESNSDHYIEPTSCISIDVNNSSISTEEMHDLYDTNDKTHFKGITQALCKSNVPIIENRLNQFLNQEIESILNQDAPTVINISDSNSLQPNPQFGLDSFEASTTSNANELMTGNKSNPIESQLDSTSNNQQLNTNSDQLELYDSLKGNESDLEKNVTNICQNAPTAIENSIEHSMPEFIDPENQIDIQYEINKRFEISQHLRTVNEIHQQFVTENQRLKERDMQLDALISKKEELIITYKHKIEKKRKQLADLNENFQLRKLMIITAFDDIDHKINKEYIKIHRIMRHCKKVTDFDEENDSFDGIRNKAQIQNITSQTPKVMNKFSKLFPTTNRNEDQNHSQNS